VAGRRRGDHHLSLRQPTSPKKPARRQDLDSHVGNVATLGSGRRPAANPSGTGILDGSRDSTMTRTFPTLRAMPDRASARR